MEAVLKITEAGKENSLTNLNMKSLLIYCRSVYQFLSYLISKESIVEEDVKIMKNNFVQEQASNLLKNQLKSHIPYNFEGGSDEQDASAESDDYESERDEQAFKRYERKQNNLYESVSTIIFA